MIAKEQNMSKSETNRDTGSKCDNWKTRVVGYER